MFLPVRGEYAKPQPAHQFGDTGRLIQRKIPLFQLSVISYQLSVISYQLSVISYQLLKARGKRQNLAILLPKKKVRN
ncbi:MAG: hypothetical protein EWV75_09085 [Microcystis wesenbergii Mw_QC_S_20081001_S30D]|uniref:Uncharacterized protein n=2 Tax=Microcystis wesenbergii TaxID=44823 RepID=A0A552LUR6_9CHRO|nr:MAG: hypothetical protein EWV74_20135 [Microcystis wesenbergii Mw_QC_S_20081001_S30]TRU97473.1 MAG: hypothetical protein EWV75_09085 [Microcystis wesenbergii Mw_QC_S_20081001_S30D]TRU98318.1 MAG: hypothetical protein EWV73_15205 [Microcystis wesenbergii Mw_QC_B_20070930_S4D]TRV05135.1 MAG: hypothetical protein EWV41_16370 [Microcystis wesenbergii Mw_MB_S_20031200_S109]TRV11238.1 MAG: hypothetical protein EWV89_15440 [Microcystis wesenbergii Mw_QC_B_20070930_S4]TRV23959.1 MAG: hypothetical p